MTTSLAAYPLETSRTRSRPPSIAVYGSSFQPRSLRNQDDGELLYDLPKAITSPTQSRFSSPVSPTGPSPARRTFSPPGSRSRAHTPLPEPQRDDLEVFAQQCRAWYFKQDEPASKLMTQTLSSIPSSQRASYSRLQAAIRAEYHSTMAARRNAEFLARLRAVTPGGSLAAHMRTDPRSPAAQKERLSRFGAFISAWCTSGMPGTKPFFEALWATMRLQVLPVELGGAGPRQIEWEIDDAVFKEAAGKDFMLEAIDILKGVLGFEDSTASKRSDIWSRPNSSVGPIPESHQRSHSQPLSTHVPPSGAKGIATTTAARARAPSDPFLDSHTPRLSRSLASTQPRSPTTPTADVGMLEASGLLPTPPEDAATDDAAELGDDEYTRTWTLPDLPDADFNSLLRLFPVFIGQRQLPRFAAPLQESHDVEAGVTDDIDARAVRFGTGRIWVGSRRRSAGYRGGMWARLVAWCRRMFCR